MASFSSEVNNVPDPTSIRPVKEPRTIPANRSMETLFENISSAAQATGKYLYNSAKEDITNTVENVVETQDSKYGYGVEGAINTARNQLGMNGREQAPEQDAIASNPELQSAQSYVQKVQAAKQQGIIPDSLYWAQLNIKAKELRSRYPGWDEEINQIFDDVTGNHRLESRMRMSVEEEQKRLAASGGKEDEEGKTLTEQFKANAALIATNYPDVYQNWFSTPRAKQWQVLANVGKIKGNQDLDEANLKHMEVLKAQGGDTKQLAAQAYYTHVNSAVDAAIRTKGPNANSDSMVKQLDQMTAPGYMPSDKDADLINQHLAQVKIDLQKQFLQDRNKYIANGLTAEEADKAEKSGLQTIDTMQQFAGAKDWTMLNRYSSLQKFQTERQTYTLAQTLPWFRQGLMAKELGQAAQDIWASNNNDTLVKAFGPGNLLGLGSGEKSFDDIYNMTKRDEETRHISPEQKATIMAEAAKGVDRIYSGQVPKETVSRFVETNFSDGGSGLRDYMADLKGEAKSQFFEKLTSNNMTKAVLDTGNPKTISDYEKWMVDQFGSLPNSINVGNRLKQGDKANEVNYTYNPATYRFAVSLPPSKGTEFDPLFRKSQQVTAANLQKQTDTFNNDLYGLANFMRRTGVDPNGPNGIPKVLKDLEIGPLIKAMQQGAIKGPTEATDVSGRAPATRAADDDDKGFHRALEPTDLSGESTYPRKGEPLASVQGFIWHHTGSAPSPEGKYPSPSNIIQVLNQRGLGVQYVMDRDGKIYQALPDGSRGAHILPSEINDLNNSNTEGMEVIAADDKDITPAQVKAAKEFAKEFSKKHPGVQYFGHGEVNPSHKMADEGKTITDAIRDGQLPNEFKSDQQTPIEHRSLLSYAHQDVDASGPDDNKLPRRTLADDAADEKFTSDEILKGLAKMEAAGAARQSTNVEDRRDWYNDYMQTKDEHPFITGARYVSENGMTQGIRKLLGISADDQQATGEVGDQ